MPENLLRWVGLFVASFLLSGCTHWVVIRSTPPGARAKVNGDMVGTTPFFFEETTGWSKVYRLELELDGYEPRVEKLEQDDLQWKYACPAACLCVPTLGISLTGCLFSYGLADEYNFVMVPLDDSVRPPAPAPAPDSKGAAPDAGPPPADVPKKEDDRPVVVPF
ncbi:MAG: PEGA domain-containing protein [Deltaproteobacteria bacterium]|nr:PEGA domain-containing protein [Deltaproteobacteria bacterium]